MEDKQNLLILRSIFNSIAGLMLCWCISFYLFRWVNKTKVKTKNGSFIGSGFCTVLALSSNDHSLTIAVKKASSNLDLNERHRVKVELKIRKPGTARCTGRIHKSELTQKHALTSNITSIIMHSFYLLFCTTNYSRFLILQPKNKIDMHL